MTLENIKIGFIGAGNMARAIGEGLIKKDLVNAGQIIVSAPSDSTLEPWKQIGAETTHKNGEVVSKANVIFLAIKPYQLDTALEGVNASLPSDEPTNKLFVSVLAGITIDTLINKLQYYGLKDARLVRSMPNTPMMVGEGCSGIQVGAHRFVLMNVTVLTPHSSATTEDITIVKSIFMALGKCDIIPENLMAAACGLISCGPAFVYLVIEALSDGGVKQGIPREISTTFAAQTVYGAAKMVLETGKHPGQLKDEVCSPGGTTIYGVHALENRGVRCALIDAVEAGTKRGEEIGKANK